MFRKLFSSFWFHSIFLLVVLCGNIFLSIEQNSWHWFARSGSIIVIIGAIMTLRFVVRRGFRQLINVAPDIDFSWPDPNKPEEVFEFHEQQKDKIAMLVGTILMIIGTLIWAYGDLI